MVRLYCDLCNSEIKQDDWAGAKVEIYETNYLTKNKGVTRTLKELCADCTVKLKEKIKEIEDERKPKDILTVPRLEENGPSLITNLGEIE